LQSGSLRTGQEDEAWTLLPGAAELGLICGKKGTRKP
jgi:hypothetical protein